MTLNTHCERVPMEGLWDRWRAHYTTSKVDPDSICRDGIVDQTRFRCEQVRVLFVLREVNDWKGGDLPALLRTGPKFQVWHTVGRWAAGLLNGFPSYEVVNTLDAKADALSRIASINLKKSSGGSFSNLSVVNAFAAHDRELLREQITAIDPTVIIACGTFDSLIWLLELPVHPDSVGERHATASGGTKVIPWRHPSRASGPIQYEAFAKRVRAADGA